MHIQMQCCGIVLMMVLLFFYMRQRRISLNTEKAFLRAFCLNLFCVVLDVTSIVVIYQHDNLPGWFVDFICKSYLITLIGVALCSLLYICVDIYVKKEDYRKAVRKYEMIALVDMVIVYALPIYYQFDEDGTTFLVTYGPSNLAAFWVAVGFLVVNFYLIKKEKNKINPRRREAVLTWMVVWIFAAMLQYCYSGMLVLGFACSIGMVVLYLKLENPETNLDRQTGMFNHGALVQYVRQMYSEGKEFSVLSAIFDNSFQRNINSVQSEEIIMEIVEFFQKLPDVYVFKNTEDEIFMVFKDNDCAEKKIQSLLERFEDGWGEDRSVHVRPRWIHIPDAGVLNSVEDMLYLIRDIRQNSKDFLDNSFFLAGKETAEEMYRKKQTEQLILEAIENDWVEVFYQPIYSTKEHCFTSAEALVRIRDEKGSIVPPGIFIDVAEQNGMILKLGEIVFEKVCRFIKEHDIKQYGLHYIEANLSVVQCSYEQLAEDYIRIMEKYNIPPELINLEITESASMEAKRILLDNMQKLIDYGVKFSLDDFGTGQSNLNYIVDMPVDIVKFDKDMINAYFENGKAKYVMDAAMHMIHGMDLEIVSEGIETKEQYETMEKLGISYIQGYFFSKPLAEQEFLKFIS